MATTITPQFIQVDSVFNAADLRVASNKPSWEGVREGVAQYSHLFVEAGGGGNLSVDVSAGVCYVRGDSQIDQGLYRCEFETDNNLVLSTADATHPRVDRIVVTVRDNTYDASGYYEAKLQVRTGTATSGATLANLTGAQAIADSEILLADVLVNAGATAPSSISTRRRALVDPSGSMLPVTGTLTVRAGSGVSAFSNDRQAFVPDASSLTDFAPFLNKYGQIEAEPVAATDRYNLIYSTGAAEFTAFYPVVASETIEAVDTIALSYDTQQLSGTTFGFEFILCDKFGIKMAKTNYYEESDGYYDKELALSASIDIIAGESYYLGVRMYVSAAVLGIKTASLYGSYHENGSNDYMSYRRGELWTRATADLTRSSIWGSVGSLAAVDTSFNEIAQNNVNSAYKAAPAFAISYGK